MSTASPALARDIVLAARAFARLGYMNAFGHVSAREGADFLITPTAPPFLAQDHSHLLRVGMDAQVRQGVAGSRPIEAYLHAAVYRARPEVAAICRTHAPHASAILSAGAVPPIRHGFGGIVESVAVFAEVDLVHDPESGARAAAALGSSDALILRGNGVLCVGGTLGEAAARMWALEERCLFERLCGGSGPAFAPAELAARQRWYPAESARIWTWLLHLGAQPGG